MIKTEKTPENQTAKPDSRDNAAEKPVATPVPTSAPVADAAVAPASNAKPA